MSCNKTVLLIVLLLTNGINLVNAADVTITVNGRVVAKPCTVFAPSTTVSLGNLSTLDFIKPDSSSGWQTFFLTLTHCPVGTSRVKASFTGAADSTGYYKNQGDAVNLQLQLQDIRGTDLSTGSSTIVNVDASSLSARLPLKVRALSVNGNASRGSIGALINVTYTYL